MKKKDGIEKPPYNIQCRFISLSYINEKDVLRTVWIFMSVLQVPTLPLQTQMLWIYPA